MDKEHRKILLTGANGLLGQKTTEVFARETEHELILTDLAPKAEEPRKFTYYELDITNKEALKEFVKKCKPDIIINAAAFTNVDGCETERELSWRVNVDAVKNLIIASRINSSKIIHISTDYIFDGVYGGYDENATPNPLSFYGKAKLARRKCAYCKRSRVRNYQNYDNIWLRQKRKTEFCTVACKQSRQ